MGEEALVLSAGEPGGTGGVGECVETRVMGREKG